MLFSLNTRSTMNWTKLFISYFIALSYFNNQCVSLKIPTSLTPKTILMMKLDKSPPINAISAEEALEIDKTSSNREIKNRTYAANKMAFQKYPPYNKKDLVFVKVPNLYLSWWFPLLIFSISFSIFPFIVNLVIPIISVTDKTSNILSETSLSDVGILFGKYLMV